MVFRRGVVLVRQSCTSTSETARSASVSCSHVYTLLDKLALLKQFRYSARAIVLGRGFSGSQRAKNL
jgi:uncharacterized protein (DUF3084 family)